MKPKLIDSTRPACKKRRLTIIDGAKGGVGKSLVGSFYASAVLSQGTSLTLIESDQANPDVARRFQHHTGVVLADLSDRDGWISLLQALETIESRDIVMPMPAGLNNIGEIQELLSLTLASLGIELQVIFCLSRQNDSIALIDQSLGSGLSAFATRAIALKNGFFGRDETFDRWRNSDQRTRWINAGFAEAFFPELHHQLIDLLENDPQPLHAMLTAELPVVLRIELDNWLRAARSSLDLLLADHPADKAETTHALAEEAV
ncbi:hypothetical protein [Methylophaga sp.]|uniref:hypothetical protein n=1 Tax=Methylophaga sp. TaxID=2024840 RepID=UPI0027281731|nr:hypothetical protein [Methylophaga sp.]MDO8828467.1 hypothetical protein [Methylophaga sp.]